MASIAENHSSEYFSRWRPFFVGIPGHFMDHFISIDMSGLWRRHVIWSKPSVRDLRQGLIQRFASTTVLLSVIVAAEIGVMSSNSKPADDVRDALKDKDYGLEWWTGVALAVATFVSIGALIANFTAWAIFTAVSDANLKLIARSSIGLYGAQLPNRLVVCVLYLFFIWVCLFWYVIMPTYVATGLSIGGSIILVYITSTYSALGHLAMHSGVLSEKRIIDEVIADNMTPQQLSEELLRRTTASKKADLPLNLVYRSKKLSRSSSTAATRACLDRSTYEGSGETGILSESGHQHVK